MIGERIKKVRKNANLTQQEFADNLSVKRNTVATWESGRSVPQDSAISLICREYGVNETWLRTGEGEMLIERSQAQPDCFPDCLREPGLFKAKFVEGMAKLTDEQWAQAAQIISTIFGQKK